MIRKGLILVFTSSLAAAQDKITYDDHVFPLFQQTCLNCHNPDKAKGGLDLSSYSGTMKGSSGGKIAEPGDPGSSLITVVMQTAEPKMPPEGEKLSNDQIGILKRWIEGGLLENKSSSARKASKPKFEATPRTDPAAKPDGPPPMPAHLLLEPPVVTAKASAIHSIAASPWAPLLAITGQHQVLLHHSESLELVGILPFPEGDPVSLAFTPDARYLIVGGGVPGKSGLTVTFDVTNGTRLLTVGKEFDSVLAADIRPGFDIVATGGPSRLLKLWKSDSGEPLKSIKKHTDWITALDLSPDGVLLASGDRNGGVWVWESESGSEFHTLRAHQAAITTTAFRADSNILATSSEDGTVRFWEMNGGTEVKKIDAHPGGVTSFSFARDGTSLTAGRDMKAKLWKPDFNHIRDIVQNLPALPTAVALDAEGKRAFIGDTRGTVLVFDTADGKALGEIQSNPPSIAARLLTITARISEQEQAFNQFQTLRNARTAERDKAKQVPETPKADLDALEKSLTDSTAGMDTAAKALESLRASHKHWTAAGINTRLLEARRISESSVNETEEALLAFTESSRKVAAQAEILNRKRTERETFAARNDTAAWSPEARAEFNATIAALDVSLLHELEAYQSVETEHANQSASIDPAARLTLEKKAEADSLQQAYQKALE